MSEDRFFRKILENIDRNWKEISLKNEFFENKQMIFIYDIQISGILTMSQNETEWILNLNSNFFRLPGSVKSMSGSGSKAEEKP